MDTCEPLQNVSEPLVGLNDDTAMNHVASFTLKLREVDKLSGSACEEVRHNVATMLSMSREHLLNDMKKMLNDMDVSEHFVSDMCSVISNPTPFENACTSLSTERDINKYVESKFPYVNLWSTCLRLKAHVNL